MQDEPTPAVGTGSPPPEPPVVEDKPSPPPEEKPAPAEPEVVVPAVLHARREAPWYRDTVGDVLLVAGVTSAVVAAVFYNSTLDAGARTKVATDIITYANARHDAESSSTIAIVSMASSLVLVGASIIHYVVHDRRQPGGVAIAPAPGGALVTWSGRL